MGVSNFLHFRTAGNRILLSAALVAFAYEARLADASRTEDARVLQRSSFTTDMLELHPRSIQRHKPRGSLVELQVQAPEPEKQEKPSVDAREALAGLRGGSLQETTSMDSLKVASQHMKQVTDSIRIRKTLDDFNDVERSSRPLAKKTAEYAGELVEVPAVTQSLMNNLYKYHSQANSNIDKAMQDSSIPGLEGAISTAQKVKQPALSMDKQQEPAAEQAAKVQQPADQAPAAEQQAPAAEQDEKVPAALSDEQQAPAAEQDEKVPEMEGGSDQTPAAAQTRLSQPGTMASGIAKEEILDSADKAGRTTVNEENPISAVVDAEVVDRNEDNPSNAIVDAEAAKPTQNADRGGLKPEFRKLSDSAGENSRETVHADVAKNEANLNTAIIDQEPAEPAEVTDRGTLKVQFRNMP